MKIVILQNFDFISNTFHVYNQYCILGEAEEIKQQQQY